MKIGLRPEQAHAFAERIRVLPVAAFVGNVEDASTRLRTPPALRGSAAQRRGLRPVSYGLRPPCGAPPSLTGLRPPSGGRFAERIRVLPVAAFALAASFALVSGLAFADSPQDAMKKAQPLFDEATAEMDRGEYDKACPKLLEVTRLAPEGIGAKETLAECYAKQGRIASAYQQYVAAAGVARAQKKPDREKAATAAAVALRSRLPTLTLEIDKPPEGLTVRLGDQVLAAEAWKTTVFVDPGKLHVEVSAPGKKTFVTDVDIRGEKASVTIRVPSLSPATDAPPVVPVEPTSKPVDPVSEPVPDSEAPEPPSPTNARLIGGIVLSGVGLVSLGLGVVSSFQVAEAQKKIEPFRYDIPAGTQVCAPYIQSGFSPAAQATIQAACSQGALFAPLQYVFYGLGIASGGVSAYLLATSGSPPSGPSITMIAPSGGRDHLGAVLSGTF